MGKESRYFFRENELSSFMRYLLIIVFLSISITLYLSAQEEIRPTPPPAKLIFKGDFNHTTDIGDGKASVRESWYAERVDYNWLQIKQKYQDFYDWYKKEKQLLEQRFNSATWGTKKITAARALFDFSLDADERKKQLEHEDIYSGKWEGHAEVEVNADFLGTSRWKTSIKISLSTVTINKGAQEPLLIVSGNGRNGKCFLKYQSDGIEYSLDIEETLKFQGIISGKFYVSQNLIIFDVTPKNVTGSSKGKTSFYRGGELTTIGNYGKGAMKTKASWPEMEALIQYLKVFAGDTSLSRELESTVTIPQKEILEPFQFDGSLNWTPEELPDLKHKYFRQWFDTFWKVLKEKINTTKDHKSKADTAKELYEQYVKKALSDGQQHKIHKNVMDHCRLWPGKSGSSLDESFDLYFENTDGWYQEQIDSASNFKTKRDRSKTKFDFAILTTQNFQWGYLSEELRDKRHLWIHRVRSYIDSCFDKYISNHNKHWETEMSKAPSFESKDSIAVSYFREVPLILLFAQQGVLSDDIIKYYKLEDGLYNGYPDKCFRIGWELGNFYHKKLPLPGTATPIVKAYERWLMQKFALTNWGLTSSELNKEVENKWNELLDNYPSLKQKYNR